MQHSPHRHGLAQTGSPRLCQSSKIVRPNSGTPSRVVRSRSCTLTMTPRGARLSGDRATGRTQREGFSSPREGFSSPCTITSRSSTKAVLMCRANGYGDSTNGSDVNTFQFCADRPTSDSASPSPNRQFRGQEPATFQRPVNYPSTGRSADARTSSPPLAPGQRQTGC